MAAGAASAWPHKATQAGRSECLASGRCLPQRSLDESAIGGAGADAVSPGFGLGLGLEHVLEDAADNSTGDTEQQEEPNEEKNASDRRNQAGEDDGSERQPQQDIADIL